MKSIALISSGFLRNYRFFIQSDLYRRIVDEFDCGVYISTWEEDGYGGNHTADYSSEIIPAPKGDWVFWRVAYKATKTRKEAH
jgi:hypothetical protein